MDSSADASWDNIFDWRSIFFFDWKLHWKWSKDEMEGSFPVTRVSDVVWVVVNPSSPSFNIAAMEGSPDFPCRHGPVLLRSPSLNLPNISSSITHLVIRSFYCGTCLPPSLTSGTWGSWSTKKCICPQSLLHERRKTYWHGYTLYWLLYSGYFKLEVW